jgi:hypothetical protein
MTCGSGGLCWERTLAVMSGQERRTSHRMRTGADTSGQERGEIMALNWHKVNDATISQLGRGASRGDLPLLASLHKIQTPESLSLPNVDGKLWPQKGYKRQVPH